MSEINGLIEILNTTRNEKVSSFLEYLDENEISGWEKWIQFEIIQELIKKDHDIYWEESYVLNKTSQKSKKRLDIVYRRKNSTLDKYVGVEIKVQRFPEYSVRGILNDLSWPTKINKSNWEFRSIVGVAFYSKSLGRTKSKYRDFVDYLVENQNAKLIDFPGWHCLALCWDVEKLKLSDTESKKSYRKFYAEILKAANDHDISV